MKRIFTRTWCDWPGCADEAMKAGVGQETRVVQTWFYPPGKGHKPRIITNDLCEEHFGTVIDLRDKLKTNGELVSETPNTVGD
jgi:hypothetical protein